MELRQKVEIPTQWSYTGLRCVVTILAYDNGSYLVRYGSGYEEWLPYHIFV